MVDAEPYIYDHLVKTIKAQYSWGSKVHFSNDFVTQPSKFPFVSISEEDNRTEIKFHSTSNEENAARLTYQVDVWSNNTANRKREARRIMKAVDEAFQKLGFRRTYLNNDPEQQDVSLYRVYGRYTAIVEEQEDDFVIYHRP